MNLSIMKLLIELFEKGEDFYIVDKYYKIIPSSEYKSYKKLKEEDKIDFFYKEFETTHIKYFFLVKEDAIEFTKNYYDNIIIKNAPLEILTNAKKFYMEYTVGCNIEQLKKILKEILDRKENHLNEIKGTILDIKDTLEYEESQLNCTLNYINELKSELKSLEK